MRTLVTGGAGFIGSNLVDGCSTAGDEVTVLDDLSTGPPREPRRGARRRRGAGRGGHPRRRRASARLFERARPEAVFHLAAQIDVRKSVADPAFDASINVGGTANLLEAAREAGTLALRLHLHRRGDLRRGRGPGAAAGRGRRGRAALPLRPEQVRRRGLPGALRAPLRALRGQPAARQRLRAAPGPARRGGRDRDLLRAAARRRAADRLRRRPPDPRLHICGRRRRRRRWRRPPSEAAGAFNVGTGIETTVLELVESLRRLGGRERLRGRSSPRPARARCSGSRSTPRAPPRRSAGAPQTGLDEGLRLTLDSL